MRTSHDEYMLIVSHETIELNKAGILATRRAENGIIVIKDAQESPLLRRNILQDHGYVRM